MRLLTPILLVPAIALAACSGGESGSSAAPAAKPDTYAVTLQNGTKGRMELRGDNSFILSDGDTGQAVREGTWRHQNGQFCLTDTQRPNEVCMDEAAGENGAFELSARGQVVMSFKPAGAAQ